MSVKAYVYFSWLNFKQWTIGKINNMKRKIEELMEGL